MAFPNYMYSSYPPGYYPQPNVPDQMAQMRQNQYQLPLPVPSPPPQQAGMVGVSLTESAGIVWVKSKEEVDKWPVAAGKPASFWDENRPLIYMRFIDSTGKPDTKIFRREEIMDEANIVQDSPAPPAPQVDLSQYIKRSEVEDLKNEIDNLWNQLETIQGRLKRTAKNTKPREEASNE